MEYRAQTFQPVSSQPGNRRARNRHDALGFDSLLVKGRKNGPRTINARAENVPTAPAFVMRFATAGVWCPPKRSTMAEA